MSVIKMDRSICQTFLFKDPKILHIEEWIRTVYKDKDGNLWLPAVPASLESEFLSFLLKKRINHALGRDKHIYMKSGDIEDLFPERIESVKEAKDLVQKMAPCQWSVLH